MSFFNKTGNLWQPIMIHFIWNFLLGPLSGLTVKGNIYVTFVFLSL